jgi:hypothetical protein
VDTSPDEIVDALTDFDSESVIATRRIVIDADTSRGDRQASSQWRYVALVAAFVLGMCTAVLIVGW